MYVEGNGGGGLRSVDVSAYRDGLWRMLALLDMHPDVAGAPPKSARLLLGGAGDVDASLPAKADGWCVTSAEPGQVLAAGELIADIVGIDGVVADQVTAPSEGTVMFLRRRADVAIGDTVAMLGPVPEQA
jgi:predicted deacylase